MERPMADQTLYLPPTQDSNPNIFFASMPNFVTSSSLVESATKCLAMNSGFLADLRNHSLAVAALVQVSAVVNVLLAMRNMVVSGTECLRASAIWVPSILETKNNVKSVRP